MERELDKIDGAIEAVYEDVTTAQAARRNAGIVGTMAGVSSFMAATIEAVGSINAPISVWLLLSGFPLMLIVYFCTLLFKSEEPETGQELTRLVEVHHRETSSLAWPLVAISLLSPLTIHFGIYAIAEGAFSLHGFAEWMKLSLLFSGPAHAALVYQSIRYAKRITGPGGSDRHVTREALRAIAIASVFAMIPGFALLIPSLVVFATGLAFIPLAFRLSKRILEGERLMLTTTEGMLEAQRAAALAQAKAALVSDETSSSEKVAVLRYLASNFDRPVVKEVLDLLFGGTDQLLLGAAMLLALEFRYRPSNADLRHALEFVYDDTSLEAIAKLIGLQVGEEPEELLIELLERGRKPRLAALRQLGARVGTMRSVEAINAMRERHFHERGVDRGTNLALKRILWRERRIDNRAGGLSIAQPVEPQGGLSLSATSGALSAPVEDEASTG